MGYKEDIEAIKSDIVGEGKFLEYFLHFERFYKKFKFVILGAIVVLIGLFAFMQFQSYQEEQRVEAANLALTKLLKDPKNEALLAELKGKSDELYSLYVLSSAANDKDVQKLKTLENRTGFIGKIAKYQIASLESDGKKIADLRLKEDPVFEEFSLLQTAYLYAKEGKYEEAKIEIAKLPFSSQFKTNGDIIAHFGVTK